MNQQDVILLKEAFQVFSVNNNNQQMNVDNLPLLFESIDLKDAPDKLTKKWKKKFSISDKQETLTFDELLHIVDVLKNDAKNSRQAEEDVEVDDETIELFKKFDTENKGFENDTKCSQNNPK